MSRGPAWIGLVTLLGAAAVAGQTRQPFGTGTAAIAGTVVDSATGRPVAGATVALWGQNTQAGPRMTTGADGTFQFDRLPPGPLTIEANKTGFTFGGHGKKRADGSGLPLPLADGARVDGIVITIWSRGGGATISGRVVDERGEPIAAVPVRALRRLGDRFDSGAASADTDAQGHYTLGVPPGRYVVQAMVGSQSFGLPPFVPGSGASTPAARANGVRFLTDPSGQFVVFPRAVPPPPDRDGRLRAFTSAFFGAPTAAGATIIELARGDERKSVDIVLRAQPAVRIAGTVTGPRGPVEGALLRLLGGDEDLYTYAGLTPTATARADGRFDFVIAAAGRYVMQGALRLPPTRPWMSPQGFPTLGQNDMIMRDPDALWVRQPVSADRDVTDLAVRMNLGTLLQISIELDNGASAASADLRGLSLGFGDPGSFPDASTTSAAEPGRLRARLAPGRYFARVTNRPTGWVPVGLLGGGNDLADKVFEVGSAEVNLTVKLTRTPSRLTGTVTDDRGQPASDATVVLFPADSATWEVRGRSPWRFFTTRTTTARYTLENLPPGDYLLVAVDDSVLEDFPNPALMARLASGAARVTLTKGSAGNFDLKLK